MRHAFLTTCAATALAFGLVLPAYAAGKSATHTGCLAQGDEPKEFKLTNVDGGTGEYELVGGKNLKDHVGHKIQVKGKLAPAKGEKSEAAHEHLRVTSMKHLAATCP